jgi:lysophospholipase L1-like esterase
MKPLKTLFFILSVFLLLLVGMLYFPKDGIVVTKNVKLQFPTIYEFFFEPQVEYADISGILYQSEELGADADSVELVDEVVGFDTVRADASILKKKVFRFDFPDNDPNALYPFFKSLSRIKTSKNRIRIMHYGDSQIEGDRMTAFIRNKMQKRFGGSGPGLISAVQPYDFQYSIKQTNEGDWYRYTAYGNVDSTLQHNRYGALASFSRFTPYDSIDNANYTASVFLEEARQSYPSVRDFQVVRVFYGHNSAPFTTELYAENELVDADLIPPSSTLQVMKWVFDEPVRNIQLKFEGNDSPEIYGIALDASNGVAVDNVAMRGSSGLEFSKINRSLLKNIYNELNVELLILQFGGNVVPYIGDGHERYERWFRSQLMVLKSLLPNVPIIVIGVADMSIKDKDRYKTYPNLINVRNSLKNATLSAGGVYWDMFGAMGGENSMPSWVFAKPALASTDFVHFNYRGARIIAEMFYNALIFEYGSYQEQFEIKQPEITAE